jgi:microcystin-dependent protein
MLTAAEINQQTRDLIGKAIAAIQIVAATVSSWTRGQGIVLKFAEDQASDGRQYNALLCYNGQSPAANDQVLVAQVAGTDIVLGATGLPPDPTAPPASYYGALVGEVKAYAGSSAPNGYLLCDGTAVSRTTYANLFTVIGTTYGAGDGSTTFNVPNLKGRVVLCVGDSGTAGHTNHALASSGGEEAHTLTTNEIPSHTHNGPNHSHSYGDTTGTTLVVQSGSGATVVNQAGNTLLTGAAGTGATTSTGGSVGHNTLPPYLTLNYIIRT